jgi:hypothetical protein
MRADRGATRLPCSSVDSSHGQPFLIAEADEEAASAPPQCSRRSESAAGVKLAAEYKSHMCVPSRERQR